MIRKYFCKEEQRMALDVNFLGTDGWFPTDQQQNPA